MSNGNLEMQKKMEDLMRENEELKKRQYVPNERMPHQLHFDATFWPSLIETSHHRIALGSPLTADFFVNMTQALAILGTHEIAMMRIDFVRFPIYVPLQDNDVDTRFISLGDSLGAPKILFKFSGIRKSAPFQAIAGESILVVGIVH
jgi:hypothetical protein